MDKIGNIAVRIAVVALAIVALALISGGAYIIIQIARGV